MSRVFFYKEFNDQDLGDTERKKFDQIVKDLKESELTYQGNIKLISSKGGIKYLRAKLSDEGRLLFTQVRYNNQDAFVILEVIPHHDYEKSPFLKSTEKTKSIEIQTTEEVTEKSSDIVEIKDLERAHWLGKLITFSRGQEDIVENAKLPLMVSGSAGSGKTSVALEKFRKIEEKFEEGKVLYITQSENLINQTKELYEHVYYDKADDEFKIGIPDRIEFLSLHDFLEKRAEDIKGKKPIDRSKFFSWFNEVCKKEKFKEHKKDGDKIFEEFTAVIAGGGLTKKEEYKELGSRQAIFPKEKRDHIYSLFEEYKGFIEGNLEYYDHNLIAHKCTEEKIYDAVVVDEVQDLTESTLSLILKSLRDESKGNFLLCGDVNQVIHPSFFSKSRLKSFLSEYTAGKDLSICNLKDNYRNSQQVIELANRILHLKNYCFASEDKMTADEKEAFFMNSDAENIGNASVISDNEKEKIAGKVSNSTNWAVLVLDNESKENARKLFNTPLVFNIHEAKGLEYKNVVLYEFISHGTYNRVWSRICSSNRKDQIEQAIREVRDSYNNENVSTSRKKNKEDKSFEEFKFYINALYVAISRAIDGVYIIGNEKKCNLLKVIKPEKIVSVDIKKEESNPEDWKNEALKLIDQGKMEQAENIAKTKLSNNKEYAQEIISALKVKGYDISKINAEFEEKQEKLKYQQLEQEIEKSNSGNLKNDLEDRSSQSYKNLKAEQNPRELRRLNKNTDRLFLALKNIDLNKAKNLIKQGINADYKDENNGTPLHFVVGNGSKEIVDALLEQDGIDVNAANKDGVTPLHLAAHRGDKGIVCALLKKEEIDVNSVDIYKLTPLHAAADEAHEEVVDALLERDGIKINEQSKDGSTPLHVAARGKSKEIVDALLKKRGIKINECEKNGATPLYVAIRKNNEEIVATLLKEDVIDVNAAHNDGDTPLYAAIHEGHRKIVDALLKKNEIDVNKARNDGTSPLHVAVIKDNEDVVQLLLDNGAEVNAKDEEGNTPLLLGLEGGYSEIIDLLLANPNINVGYIDLNKHSFAKAADKRKLVQKKLQDSRLFSEVKKAEVDEDEVKEVEKLLKLESKYGLNYSKDANGETTLEIAIKAGGKLLNLLYDYAEKNIGRDTEIFKRLEKAKEQEKNPRSQLHFSTVSRPSNLELLGG